MIHSITRSRIWMFSNLLLTPVTFEEYIAYHFSFPFHCLPIPASFSPWRTLILRAFHHALKVGLKMRRWFAFIFSHVNGEYLYFARKLLASRNWSHWLFTYCVGFLWAVVIRLYDIHHLFPFHLQSEERKGRSWWYSCSAVENWLIQSMDSQAVSLTCKIW